MAEINSPDEKITQVKTKKPKRKGPIRIEAVGPFFIFAILVWAYFFFLFDTNLKWALEYGGTQGNGAEVDIGTVHTSFWHASLEIRDIQVTDAVTPRKNSIQIGEVHWRMLWDALLRGKIAIDDASIMEIAIGVPRAKPGRVLPPPPPVTESAFDKLRKSALDSAQKQFAGNALGDAAGVLNGGDSATELKNLEGQLKTPARIKELQAEFTLKQATWSKSMAQLPQSKDIDDLQKRIKAVKLGGYSNPAELQTALSQLDAIIKDANAKIKIVQDASTMVQTDLSNYQKELKELDGMIQQDIKDVEGRLHLPKLDVKSLSQSIFGPMFLNKVRLAESYMAKARSYMPPKKTAAEKAEQAPPMPHEREKGKNYSFGRAHAYPLFWLKHAAISSKSVKGAAWSGDLVGTLDDVTNDPPIIGKPMIAAFKGDFPIQQIFGIDGKLIVDHTTDHPVEKLEVKVAGFPLLGRALIESPDVTLGFGLAQGTTDFHATLEDGEIKIISASSFEKSAHAATPEVLASSTTTPEATPLTSSSSFLVADAKQPILAEILKKTVAEVPKVTLNASVEGPWSALRFDIDSNLGRDLAGAFDRQLQAKINEQRAKIQAMVNSQIGEQKAKLTAQFDQAKAQLDKLLKAKQAEVDKSKSQVDQAKDKAINSQKNQLQDSAQKAAEDLKKKLGF